MKLFHFIGFIWVFIVLKGFFSTPVSKSQKESNETIKIGLLIQDNKSIEAKKAAEIAVRNSNARGGINGKPLQLITRSMEGPWGTGSKQAIDLIFNEKVWAIVGSHDGRNAHLVEQASAKTQTVFLSAWSSDPTLSKAFVPWYFSCVPNDDQQSQALIEEIYDKYNITSVAIVSDNGYDANLASETFLKTTKKMKKPAPLKFSYDNLSKNYTKLINQVENAGVKGIVLFGQPPATTEIIQQIKQRGIKVQFFGSLLLFGENTSEKTDFKKYDNVVLITPLNGNQQMVRNFQKEFIKETGKTPGAVAAYAFDGMNLLIEAIRNSQMDKEKFKKSLFKIHYNGVTGDIQFDDKGNRIGKIDLAKVKNGIPVVLQK